METNRYIIDFYNHYDEDSRLAPRHGMVEFLTTMRYIERFIRPGDRVLEIGAGTGRYSHTLARQGYAVDAVELVEHNIEVFRQNTLPEENVRIVQGNALDLSAFPDRTYDIVLLLGPLYHLYNDEDKRQALREAIRVTKKGGVVFAAYVISDGAVYQRRAAGRGDLCGKVRTEGSVRAGAQGGCGCADESFPSDPAALCGYRWLRAAAAGGDRRDGR